MKEALNEFQLDKDELDKLDSDVEDCSSHGSDCPPSRAESDTEIYSDCDAQEVLVSDEDMPKKDVLDKLIRLASPFHGRIPPIHPLPPSARARAPAID